MTRFDPFRILSDDERAAQLAALDRYFAERDGVLDFPRRTLSRREAHLAELPAPPRWSGALAGERALWLSMLLRSNEAEAYGAASDAERIDAEGPARARRRDLHVLLHEHYHGRILRRACSVFSHEARPARPRWILRLLIQAMQRLPDSIRYAPTLWGELVGTLVVRRLQELTRLFAAQPAVEAHLRELLAEILLDEVVHVLYCRARLGPTALRLARSLSPLLTEGFLGAFPEIRRLGLGHRELRRRIRAGIEVPAGYAWLLPDEPRPAEESEEVMAVRSHLR